MMDFLIRLEEAGFSTWVRTSDSFFGYPFFLLLHTVGLGMVVGISLSVDLRILGVASRMPIRPMERFFPVMWLGFWINAISGAVLLASSATTKALSGVFWIKLGLIVLAVIDLKLIKHNVFRDPLLDKRPVPSVGRALAWLSLLLWAGAITAGRLMAYIGAGSAESQISALIGPR
jgi:hypothetical protein